MKFMAAAAEGKKDKKKGRICIAGGVGWDFGSWSFIFGELGRWLKITPCGYCFLFKCIDD
jgi:hypothetical protein